MISTRPLLIALLMSSVIWISCESEDAADVNQQRIETNYTLSYQAGDNKTTASASFLFGSTFLKINSPGSITFDGDRLKETEILGIVDYQKSYSAKVAGGTFVYTNNDGEVYENTLSLPADIDLPASLTELSIAEGAKIAWEGAPLKSGETITFHLSGDGGDFYASISLVNATFIEIDSADIHATLLGQCGMSISRSFTGSLAEATEEGGVAHAQVTSETYAVNVVE
ncbi:hypothetical protein [Marinoscillum sp.]|uniref:hypothetical protein n=1 Tax=Marinoscillum sp. TaxID=2024838 RepID=UPI003BA8B6C9